MYSLKRFVCSKCGKELANRHSLSRHKESCQSALYNIPAASHTYNISTRPPPPPTFVAAAVKESSLEPRPKNPKIQALLDEIVNDDPRRNVPPQEIHKVFSTVPPSSTSPSPKKVSTPPSTPPPPSPPPSHSPKKMLLSPPKQTLPKPSAEVIAALFPSTLNILSKSMSPSRTKGDIMGHSSDESSEEEVITNTLLSRPESYHIYIVYYVYCIYLKNTIIN